MIQYDDQSSRTVKPVQQDLSRKNEDGTYTLLKPLALRQSLDSQLRAFSNLRASEPERAKEIYDLNEHILALAQQGSLRKLSMAIQSVPDPMHILTYYIVKAYKAALLGNHLIVAGYFIDQGYPFQTSKVPHCLLEIIALVSTMCSCYSVPMHVSVPVPLSISVFVFVIALVFVRARILTPDTRSLPPRFLIYTTISPAMRRPSPRTC